MISYEDWIYEELARYESKFKKEPFFISSWDYDDAITVLPNNLIGQCSEINMSDFHYKFSEDMIALKELTKDFQNKENIIWETNNFAITANATTSLYLTLLTLIKQGKKRFLLLTPIYYSIIDTLQDFNKNITFFHLTDANNFQIDIEELTTVIRQQFIEVIVFTDPIYSTGIEVDINTYNQIVEVSLQHKTIIVVDGTLGGLEWDSNSNVFFSDQKMKILKRCTDFYLIISNPKIFFLNDLKFSTIMSQTANIKMIEDLSSQVSGGLNKAQINLFQLFYSEKYTQELHSCKDQNMLTIKQNYNLLKSALIGTELSLYATNSGYFTMIVSEKATLGNTSPIEITKRLLYNYDIWALMGHYFSFFGDNKVSLRINLMKDFRRFIPQLIEALNKYI